jgi:hypothetical protein
VGEVDMRRFAALPITLILATCSVAGSSTGDVKKVSYEKMIELNSLNVTKITTGMTKDEVVQIMGTIQSQVRSGPINNPWRVEVHDDMEILHYITSSHPPFTPILANQATPIVFKDGEVVGMGRGLLKQIKAVESPTEPSSSPEQTIEERLKTLKELYDNGTIDKETYETHKNRILEEI